MFTLSEFLVVQTVMQVLWDVRDAVDLDAQPFTGKRRSLNGRACRPMVAEYSRIHAVHLSELLHVEQENAAPQDVLKIRAARAENRLHVLETLLGLRGCIGARERAGCRIRRTLARDEDQTLEAHAGRIRTNGLREVGVVNWAMAHLRY